MADAIEQALSELNALRSAQPPTPDQEKALRTALSSKVNLIAAKAADVVAERRATNLATDLTKMFSRFMRQPAKTDKGCLAKTSAARALYAMGIDNAEVFLAGVRHHQPEASWGKPVDTAVELRGVCAIALVRMRHRDAILEAIPLLADEDPQARLAGVRAIAYDEGPSAVPLLRYKALLGDAEPEIVGQCLADLLRLSPEQSLSFVDAFLDSADPTLREMAAGALSASRRPAGFALLRERWQRSIDAATKQMLLSAIGAMRTEPAIAFLIERIADDNRTSAVSAIIALAPHRHDPALRQRVAGVVADRDEAEVTRVFDDHFS